MDIVIIVFCIITFLVLLAGLVVMIRGGKMDKKYANKLMQMRIWFQAITIALLMVAIYAAK